MFKLWFNFTHGTEIVMIIVLFL